MNLRLRFWIAVAATADLVRVAARGVQRRAAPAAPVLRESIPTTAASVLNAVWTPAVSKPVCWAGILAAFGARLASDSPSTVTTRLGRLVLEIARSEDLCDARTDRLLRLVMPRAIAPGACAAASREFVEFWADGDLLLVLEHLFPDAADRARSAQ